MFSLLLYISIFFTLIALVLCYKNKFSIIGAIFFSLLVVITNLLNFFYFASDQLTGNGITDAVIYHLNIGLSGANFVEYGYLFWIFLILITLTILSLWIVFKKNKKIKKYLNNKIIFIFIFFSLFSSPGTIDLYNLYSPHNRIRNVLSSIIYTNSKEIKFDDYYINDKPEKIGENKNFVFIYLEGLEETYSNENIFPGLTKNLNKLKEKSVYFTNIGQLKNTYFTIAGIVASNCGIPLFSPSHGNTMSGIDKYLPSAFCLSDFLKNEGYYLSYYGGADLDFAGKKQFFTTHSFDEAKGFDELLYKTKDNLKYVSNWGLYDDSLIELVYKRFNELSSSDKNFGLFSLTLDTHPPSGYPSRTCKNLEYGDGKNQMLNSVFCSDYIIGSFVDKILASQYAKNTVIVIASDHLALKNDTTEKLDKYERNNRLMIISPDSQISKEINTEGTSIDIASTILPFIGYTGNIGLGRNLLDKGLDKERDIIKKNSEEIWKNDILSLWDFPKIKDFIAINATNNKIKIDEREFMIPLIIDISPNMETKIRFGFYAPENLGLMSQLKEYKPDQSYMFIAKCEEIKKILPETKNENLCLLIKNNLGHSVIYINNNIFLSAEHIKSIFRFEN